MKNFILLAISAVLFISAEASPDLIKNSQPQSKEATYQLNQIDNKIQETENTLNDLNKNANTLENVILNTKNQYSSAKEAKKIELQQDLLSQKVASDKKVMKQKNTLKDLENRLKEIQLAENETNKIKEKISSLKDQLTKLQVTAKQYNKLLTVDNVDPINKKYSETRQRLNDLKKQLNKSKRSEKLIANLNVMIENLETKVIVLKNNLNEYEQIKSPNAKINRFIEDTHQAIRNSQSQIVFLNKELVTAQEYAAQKDSLEQEITQAEQDMQHLSNDIAYSSINDLKIDTQNKIEALKNETDKEIKNINIDLSYLQQDLKKLEKETSYKNQITTELQNLKNENNKFTKNLFLSFLKDKISSLKSKVATIKDYSTKQHNLKNAYLALKNLTSNYFVKNESLHKAKNELDHISAEKNKLSKNQHEIDKHIKIANKKYSASKNLFLEIEHQYKEKQNEIIALKTDSKKIELLKLDISVYYKQKTNIQNELNRIDSEISQINNTPNREKVNTFKDKLQNAVNEIEIKHKLKAYKEEQKKLNTELNKINNEIKKLNTQHNQLVKNNNSESEKANKQMTSLKIDMQNKKAILDENHKELSQLINTKQNIDLNLTSTAKLENEKAKEVQKLEKQTANAESDLKKQEQNVKNIEKESVAWKIKIIKIRF